MFRLSRKYRWFAMGFLLAWALSHGSILGAQEEARASYEPPAARHVCQLATAVRDVAAGQALRDLARSAGLGLVLDPRIESATRQKITLDLDKVPVETALRLIAEIVDLKTVRLGNVVFVTDPARAERMRREEPTS